MNEPQKIIAFFSQMKPEKKITVELTDDEKTVLGLLIVKRQFAYRPG